MIYKLYIVPILPRKLSTKAPRQGLSPIIDMQSRVRSNDHSILQKPIKLTSIAGVRSMISYKHTNINQTPQIE